MLWLGYSFTAQCPPQTAQPDGEALGHGKAKEVLPVTRTEIRMAL